MSRRRSSRDSQGSEPSREATIEALLDELCIAFGFCLDAAAKETLKTEPPPSPGAFTDGVIEAEGLDPMTIDTNLRNGMVALVEARAGRVL